MDEVFGISPAFRQMRFLCADLATLTEGRPLRWLVLFFEPAAGVLISYRLDRFGYLLTGRAWTLLRLLLLPVFYLLRLLSCRHEICFKADIGSGLKLRHPTLGLAVHGDAIIGKNCILSGGNSIGCRRKIQRGELVLGDNVDVGINACVLGPVKVGSNVAVGAGAVVVSDIPDGAIAVGVPARSRVGS